MRSRAERRARRLRLPLSVGVAQLVALLALRNLAADLMADAWWLFAADATVAVLALGFVAWIVVRYPADPPASGSSSSDPPLYTPRDGG